MQVVTLVYAFARNESPRNAGTSPAVLQSLVTRRVDVIADLGLVGLIPGKQPVELERHPGYKPVGFESRSCPDNGQAESSNAREERNLD